eukprot:CAMPEP_0117694108 /NCGR_PEP_ID=MMETSP0804-20121206/27256_1 /TAXON_ID=1074897 /ORGANISM="Tetraselmis astigmatica, Strain CCMP880" /LENGTH=61 /DNA_ID=CAMNT_0005507743 /DNA_START=13 /DNA_END=195 /DNA_ORIENTATION=+
MVSLLASLSIISLALSSLGPPMVVAYLPPPKAGVNLPCSSSSTMRARSFTRRSSFSLRTAS